MPLSTLRPNQIILFSNALKNRLLNNKAGFAKDYLKLLVDEVRVEGKKIRITGSYAALAQAVTHPKMDSLEKVPSFVPKWLPGTDSNRRPSD
jgi:site-specific DNA recombinase